MADKRFSDFTEVTPQSGDKLFGLQLGEPVLIDIDELAEAYQVERHVTARVTNSTVTPDEIDELQVTLAAGWWYVEGAIIWQSAATTTGIELYFSTSAGTLGSLNANWMTIGNGAGTVDQQGGTLIDGRAQRGANAPGPYLGVDTINADILTTVQGLVTIAAGNTVTLETMFRSEVAASQVAVEVGSSLLFTRYRVL